MPSYVLLSTLVSPTLATIPAYLISIPIITWSPVFPLPDCKGVDQDEVLTYIRSQEAWIGNLMLWVEVRDECRHGGGNAPG